MLFVGNIKNVILNELGNTEEGQRYLNNVAQSNRFNERLYRNMANEHKDRYLANKERRIYNGGNVEYKENSHNNLGKTVPNILTHDQRDLLPDNHPDSHKALSNYYDRKAFKSEALANKFSSYADRARERHGDLDSVRNDLKFEEKENQNPNRALSGYRHNNFGGSSIGKGDFGTKFNRTIATPHPSKFNYATNQPVN